MSGAISGINTKIIFVKMLRRVGKFNDKVGHFCSYCAKFNDALNDAVAKVDLRILTINACNTYEAFEAGGGLLMKG